MDTLNLLDLFKCPITLEIMKDPVICEDGYTYERESILNLSNPISPITRQPISTSNLVPNRILKEIIIKFESESNTDANSVIKFTSLSLLKEKIRKNVIIPTMDNIFKVQKEMEYLHKAIEYKRKEMEIIESNLKKSEQAIKLRESKIETKEYELRYMKEDLEIKEERLVKLEDELNVRELKLKINMHNFNIKKNKTDKLLKKMNISK